MKRGARGLAVILAVIMVIALFPMTASAASGKPGKVKITKFKVAAVSAATNTTTVTIKWKRVKGATGYEVFELNNKSGQWQRIKKLGRLYGGIKIRNESAGQRAYKIRAIKKKKKGKFSKTKSKFIASPVSLEKLAIIQRASTDRTSGALTYSIRGNIVTYSYDLKQMYSDMTLEEAKDPAVANALSSEVDARRNTFVDICREARLEEGITGVTIKVIYKYGGETILEKTYTE